MKMGPLTFVTSVLLLLGVTCYWRIFWQFFSQKKWRIFLKNFFDKFFDEFFWWFFWRNFWRSFWWIFLRTFWWILKNSLTNFFTNFFDEIFYELFDELNFFGIFFYTLNLLTIASFRIGVSSILFFLISWLIECTVSGIFFILSVFRFLGNGIVA